MDESVECTVSGVASVWLICVPSPCPHSPAGEQREWERRLEEKMFLWLGFNLRGWWRWERGGEAEVAFLAFTPLHPLASCAVNKNAAQIIPQSRCSASVDTADQLSHSPGQRHRNRIYCCWMCVCTQRLAAWTCRCSYVWVLICAYICSLFLYVCAHVWVCVSVPFCGPASEQTFFFLGLWK